MHDLEAKATDDVDRSDVDYQNIDLGNGLRITISQDMGMFIHFESKSGHESGMFLGNTHETPGHVWASELLASQNSK